VGVSIFELTPALVRANKFPQWGEFSTVSSPSATQVTDIIEGQAGELAAKLYAEDVVASSISNATDTNSLHSAAWLWCRETLRLMVAIEILRISSQQDPELARAYAAQLKQRLKDLDEKGATALGDATLSGGTSDPNGPTSHISQYGLSVDEAVNMSSAVPMLRKDDQL